MKIAFDCRYLGRSGIGCVCEGILKEIVKSGEDLYLIGERKKLEMYEKFGAQIVEDDTDPYSLAGLRSFDRTLNKTCDVYFTPNFLIPFRIKLPIYAVMHDLAFLDVKETTRGFKDKLIKKTLLKRCMKRAKSISCVSKFTLDRCEHYYGKLAKKCFVNYNGLRQDLVEYAKAHRETEKEDKIVFVGNVKPHKGLAMLLSAYEKSGCGMTLKIIGEREAFRTGMEIDEGKYRGVEFTGRLGDEELFKEIASARYLVLPSKYEGFGLPPLEALCLGTQPIVTDIPVFREVYGGLPVKFFRTEEELSALLCTPPEKVDCRQEVLERYNFERTNRLILDRILKGN